MSMISIDLDGSGSSIPAYLAEPTGELRGALIVIHEIWGLVDHIKNVADRYAAEGYLVVAPDILSHGGITPEVGLELGRLMFRGTDEERATAQPLMREKMAPVNQPEYAAWAVAALSKVVDYLEAQPGVDRILFRRVIQLRPRGRGSPHPDRDSVLWRAAGNR
jgi:carboxymethylenebutenolidase